MFKDSTVLKCSRSWVGLVYNHCLENVKDPWTNQYSRIIQTMCDTGQFLFDVIATDDWPGKTYTPRSVDTPLGTVPTGWHWPLPPRQPAQIRMEFCRNKRNITGERKRNWVCTRAGLTLADRVSNRIFVLVFPGVSPGVCLDFSVRWICPTEMIQTLIIHGLINNQMRFSSGADTFYREWLRYTANC